MNTPEWKQEFYGIPIEKPKQPATEKELREMNIIWRKNKATGKISNIREMFYSPYDHLFRNNFWTFNPITKCWE